MPRPIWKGHLSFGLVNIPVTLHSAEAREAHIDFDMLDSRDHSRIRYRRVNEKTGKEVPWKSIVKGVKVGSGYAVLEPEDFKRAAASVTKGLEIIQFVQEGEINPIYFEHPYYLSPGESGDKGYALLRDAMKKSRRMGIARLVIHSRERLAAIIPSGDVLTLVTMRFGDEVKPADDIETPGPGATKVASKEIDLAVQLIEGMFGTWDAGKYHDTYREALAKLVKQKARGKESQPLPEEPATTPRQDLMDLLRQSVEQGTRRHRRTPKRRVHPKRRAGRS